MIFSSVLKSFKTLCYLAFKSPFSLVPHFFSSLLHDFPSSEEAWDAVARRPIEELRMSASQTSLTTGTVGTV